MEGVVINNVFKALSDPTRRKILELLKEKDLTAGEIAEEFSISKPSISFHLNILKNSELVLTERQGQNIIYSINTTLFQDVMSWLYDFRNKEENDEK